MRSFGGLQVATELPVPPFAPNGVVTAAKRFTSFADAYHRAQDAMLEAREGLKRARRADTEAGAAALLNGKSVNDAQEHTKRAEEALLRANAELEQAQLALDKAGNEYARAVGEHVGEWLARLGPRRHAFRDPRRLASGRARRSPSGRESGGSCGRTGGGSADG